MIPMKIIPFNLWYSACITASASFLVLVFHGSLELKSARVKPDLFYFRDALRSSILSFFSPGSIIALVLCSICCHIYEADAGRKHIPCQAGWRWALSVAVCLGSPAVPIRRQCPPDDHRRKNSVKWTRSPAPFRTSTNWRWETGSGLRKK